MAKICPLTQFPVLYLECGDCDFKDPCRKGKLMKEIKDYEGSSCIQQQAESMTRYTVLSTSGTDALVRSEVFYAPFYDEAVGSVILVCDQEQLERYGF